jgi:N-acetylmuramoyl-L-alanine amidase
MHVMQVGWSDISDNFLVGGDGNVYEGRGYYYEGAYSKRYAYKSINVAFMGDYKRTAPTQLQLNALRNFLEFSVRTQKIYHDYELLGLRQVEPLWSPGDQLYEAIKTFPNWVQNPRF